MSETLLLQELTGRTEEHRPKSINFGSQVCKQLIVNFDKFWNVLLNGRYHKIPLIWIPVLRLICIKQRYNFKESSLVQSDFINVNSSDVFFCLRGRMEPRQERMQVRQKPPHPRQELLM